MEEPPSCDLSEPDPSIWSFRNKRLNNLSITLFTTVVNGIFRA
ncbi:hypothetical protein [Entomomonas moraniae]|nr:hypothetical protein [Entomomonas moraniae]